MKFGVRLAVQGEMGAPGAGFDYARLMALEAEALGFDSVWLPDHVINAHMQKRTPMLENWTVLSAITNNCSQLNAAGAGAEKPATATKAPARAQHRIGLPIIPPGPRLRASRACG